MGQATFCCLPVNQKKFPRGLIGNEISLTLNKCNRRCDTIVYDRNGNPLCIAEYKAPHVGITQKTFDQIVRYNLVLQVSYLFVSNGMKHYCCHINYTTNSYTFLPDIPLYKDL